MKDFQKCSKCGSTKEEIASSGRYFYSNGRCNECGYKDISKRRLTPEGNNAHKISMKKFYEKNKEKILARRKLELRELKQIAVDKYGGRCACCGEDRIEFLVIDHINGRGGEHRRKIKQNVISIWLKRNDYPEGFRILCYNCNCSLAFNGYCPHSDIKPGDPLEAPYLTDTDADFQG
jgi:hypothetical protein